MIELNDKESGMVGGYTYDQNHFNEKLSNMFSEILSGKSPRDLPHYLPTDGTPLINYQVLVRKGLSPDEWPAHTRFLNKPITFGTNINISCGNNRLHRPARLVFPLSYPYAHASQTDPVERNRGYG